MLNIVAEIIITLLYLSVKVLATVTLVKVIKNSKSTSENYSTLKNITVLYLGLLVFEIPFLLNVQHLISKIYYGILTISELLLMYKINEITVRDKKTLLTLRIALIPAIIYVMNLKTYNPSDLNNHIFYAYVSLIFIVASMIYFYTISKKIDTDNMITKPETFLQLGVFFCNSIPLILSISISTIYILDNELASTLFKPNNPWYNIARSSSLICYIIFLYFIQKAFKWIKVSSI